MTHSTEIHYAPAPPAPRDRRFRRSLSARISGPAGSATWRFSDWAAI